MQEALRAVEKKQLPHMLCVTNMLLHGIENPSSSATTTHWHGLTSATRNLIAWTSCSQIRPSADARKMASRATSPNTSKPARRPTSSWLSSSAYLRPKGALPLVLPDGSLFGEGVKARLKEHLMEECNLHTIVRLPNSVFKPYASIGTNLLFFEKGKQLRTFGFTSTGSRMGRKHIL